MASHVGGNLEVVLREGPEEVAPAHDARHGRAAEDWLGDVRLRIHDDRPVFIGIGPSDAVANYLEGVERDEVTSLGSAPFDPAYDHRVGGAPSTPPESQDFWVASTSGQDQTLRWRAKTGSWTAVVMNADGGRTVDATLSVGATAPALGWIAFALLLGGGVVVLLGITLVVLGAWRPRGSTTAGELAP